MVWPGLKSSPQSVSLFVGVVALILVVFWVLKILNIQRLRGEIVQLETKLGKGQEVWRDYPPLTAEEKRDFHKAQERLFRMLPRDKDIPSLLQEVSRLAREHILSNLSFNTGDKPAPPAGGQPPAQANTPPQVVPPQPTQPAPTKAPESSGSKVAESSGPIGFFPFTVAFAGDYQEIAYFLEALQKLPRLMTIQSVQLHRAVPLVGVEVVMNVYYQKGNLSVSLK